MNDEIKAKSYDNLKMVFEYQCDEVKRLKIINVVLVIITLALSIILYIKL